MRNIVERSGEHKDMMFLKEAGNVGWKFHGTRWTLRQISKPIVQKPLPRQSALRTFLMPFARQLLPAFQTLIWICFAVYLGMDIGTDNSDLILSRLLKYTSVVLCFAIALWHPATEPRDAILLRSALALTVLADFCIGILDQFLIGTAILACVHFIYASRHRQGIRSIRAEWKVAASAAALGIGALAASAPRLHAGGLLLPGILYSIPLIASLYAGVGVFVRDYYSPRQKRRIAAGSVLFFTAHILAGHAAVTDAGSWKTWLNTALWVFYLPSQYLLAMSARIDLAHMFQEKYPRAVVSRTFSVEAEEVFDAWITPKTARLWLFATEGGSMERVSIDARVGGQYTIAERRGDTLVEHTGSYREIQKPRRLVFTLAVRQASDTPDTIEVTIVPRRKACDLTLVHHLQPGAGIYAEKAAEGWRNVLSRLASVLE